MGMEPRVVVTQGAAENARDQGFFFYFAETSITPAHSAMPAIPHDRHNNLHSALNSIIGIIIQFYF